MRDVTKIKPKNEVIIGSTDCVLICNIIHIIDRGDRGPLGHWVNWDRGISPKSKIAGTHVALSL